jgi:hypothetical protein
MPDPVHNPSSSPTNSLVGITATRDENHPTVFQLHSYRASVVPVHIPPTTVEDIPGELAAEEAFDKFANEGFEHRDDAIIDHEDQKDSIADDQSSTKTIPAANITPSDNPKDSQDANDDARDKINDATHDAASESFLTRRGDIQTDGASTTGLSKACTVVLDPKGHIMLIVGDNRRTTGERTLIVSSTLKLVSTQWAALLSAHSRPLRHPKPIHLPHEDADMMLLLMAIVHTKFEQVPRKLDLSQLVELASICQKYDMNAKVRPYIAGWLRPHQEHIMQPGYEKWLCVSHQFGLDADYAKLSKHLAIECRVNRKNELLAPGTDRVLSEGFPEGCLCKFLSLSLSPFHFTFS